MPSYTANYHIKHGISHGLGSLYDWKTEETKTFQADTVLDALSQADDYAASVADNWLCGLDGKVVVRIKYLKDGEGKQVNVIETLRKAVSASKALDDFLTERFPDGQTLTTVRTVADHLVNNSQ